MKRVFVIRQNSDKWHKRRSIKTEGSVSIFLIMVLAFVFLFTAVLIDYARIAAVNVQEERLARAGVRSVMSSYDIELQEKYGLFAFGNSDGDMLLSQVLNDNLRKSGRGDAFHIVPYALESSSLEWSRPLGSYDIIRRQIIEDMKYKAPIDFALELAGKFKPLSAAMGEASRATKVLSKMQPLYDEREQALDLMLERRSQAAESGRTLLYSIMNPPLDYIPVSGIGNIQTAADISAQYNDYIGKYYSDLYRDSKEPAEFTYELAHYQKQVTGIVSRFPTVILEFHEKHERLLEESRVAFKKAQQLNDEMKAVLEASRRESGDKVIDPAGDWDIPGSTGGMSVEPLQKLREQEDSLIISSADMNRMWNNVSSQQGTYGLAESEVSRMLGVLNEALGVNGDSSRLMTAVLAATRTLNDYLQNYGEGGSVIASELAFIEQHRSSDYERKQLEKEAKYKLGEAKKLLGKIGTLGDEAADSIERYQLLRQYYEENIAFNNQLESELPVELEVESNPYAASSSAMANMDETYAAMGTIMDGARDRLYQTEYCALYFQHFDVSKLAALLESEDSVPVRTDQLNPDAQELEYILYGFHNPAGNVAAAYSEIFAMRLAVRTMEGFIEKASLGNPLAVLAAALLYGIQQSIQDMLLLCQTDKIPLTKYIPGVQLSYRDHLRLFMVLHGGGEVQLSRVLALIRLNTGINPAERRTYASANIRIGMRLWFLPGVIKLLDYSAGLSGDVEGNIYYRAVKADFSY